MTEEQLNEHFGKSILATKSTNEVKNFMQLIVESIKGDIRKHCLQSYSLNGKGAKNWEDLIQLESSSHELDCGWLLWSFQDKKLNEHMIKLWEKEYGKDYYSNTFMLSLVPFQSTRLQSYAGDLLTQHILDTYGVKMNFRVHLD